MTDEVNLININAESDEATLVAMFEAATGKTLYPAQDERIMLSVINQLSVLNQMKFNEGLKNCFIKLAQDDFLDLYGDLLDCPRLNAQSAVDTLQVTLYETFSTAKTIAKGAQVMTKDSEYIFETTADLTIPAGSLTGTVSIKSVLAGSALNSYATGEINILITDYDYVESVVNLDGASGGIDREKKSDYLDRLLLAPEKFSTAGTTEGYEYFVKSAHPSIIDVKVKSSSAGVIDIYLLTTTGTASTSVINAVKSVLNADKIRPLTDKVNVYSCNAVNWALDADITLTKTADETTTRAAVAAAINAYFATLKKKLGLSIVKSQIIAILSNVDGVYSVDPDSIPDEVAGDDSKYFNCSIDTLSYGRVS